MYNRSLSHIGWLVCLFFFSCSFGSGRCLLFSFAKSISQSQWISFWCVWHSSFVQIASAVSRKSFFVHNRRCIEIEHTNGGDWWRYFWWQKDRCNVIDCFHVIIFFLLCVYDLDKWAKLFGTFTYSSWRIFQIFASRFALIHCATPLND